MGKVLLCAGSAVFTSITALVYLAQIIYKSSYESMLNCAVAMLLVVSAMTCWSMFMDAVKEYLNEQNISD